MRSLAVISAVVAVVAVGHADPAPSRARLDALLHKGREQQGAKRYTEAIATFDAYLALAPDDPIVLGELGWTAYLLNDLAKARDATLRAVALQAAPNVRSAVLYNLGLIEQARGDTAAAVAAYADALRVRPNAIVRAALKQLDAAAAAPFDPYRPAALTGPFASLAAYCKTLPATHTDVEGTCDCACVDVPGGTRKLAAPFRAVQLFKRGCGYVDDGHGFAKVGFIEYGLAVEVAGSWYVETVAHSRLIGHGGERVTLVATTPHTIGDAAAFAVEYRIRGTYAHRVEANDWDRSELVVVGVGASGTPSGTPAIARKSVEVDEFGDSGPKKALDVALDVTFAGDAVDVAGQTTGLDQATASDLLGHHPLVFP